MIGPEPAPVPPFAPLPEAAWAIACDTPQLNPPRPNHDKPEVVDSPFHGAPFGGFGAGTFARTYRGDFARWHLRAGRHTYRSLPACAQLLSVFSRNELLDAFVIGPDRTGPVLSRWRVRSKGFTYHALYPLSWFEGTAADHRVAWRLTQFSPILPHNYRETSLPVAVFRFQLHNASDVAVDVRVATSWENVSITAPGEPVAGGTRHQVHPGSDGASAILWMGRQQAHHLDEEDGAYALAVSGGSPFAVPAFDATGDGSPGWTGLTSSTPPRLSPGESRSDVTTAGLLGASAGLEPGRTHEITFALAWHFPVVTFGSGRRWYRRYTRFYVRGVAGGGPDDTACRIARDALALAGDWQRAIRDWQAPFLRSRPPALTRALFNALYILADGGTMWESGEVENERVAPAPEIPGGRDVGRFSILECFTYPYYATLDVRYYGSVPLLYFWPELERQVLLQFAHAVSMHDGEKREMLHVEEVVRRKRAGAVPHDLGSPDEDPWVKVNAYDDIDPNRWKDLGPKFVLLVARYMAVVGWEDRGFLRGAWPAIASAMATLEKQDTDGDGLPENEGIPDQTFDKWPMTGPSAYCSGLTVAALDAAVDLARWSGNSGKAKSYESWHRRAVASMRKKLWLGDAFAFDAAEGNRSLVMAGQLSGEWALAMAGLASAIDVEKVRMTLETIWRTCAAYRDDQLVGLRNGAARRPNADPDNRHAREIWPGINYPIAALMVLNGMHAEATELVSALSRVIFQDRPFAFNTPEAWDTDGNFRGALYMRPLSVWSVEEALRRVFPEPDLSSFLVPPGGGDE